MTDKHGHNELLPEKGRATIERLFKRYYRPLVMFAMEYTHDLEESKDIVQDFFLRLWRDRCIDRMAPEKLSSYLYVSVRNACRSRAAKKDALNNSMPINGFDIPVEWVAAIDEDMLARARDLLSQMPPRMREAMEYVIMKDYSYREAAARMGISVNTIKFLLKAGLKKARGISLPALLIILGGSLK